MNAADIMTTNVISVEPDATVQAVARTLLANRISAVPVIDGNCKLLGIVSEGDLMRRAELGTDRARPWWLAILAGREGLAAEYVKEHTRRVTDVMTHNVITATPETPVREIATLLEKNLIKRIPIVRDDKVVGIVSRANLLQALACSNEMENAAPDDSKIRKDILERLKRETWARPSLINVIVQDGKVELWGIVDTETERKAVCVAAETAAGVRAVNNRLILHPGEAGY